MSFSQCVDPVTITFTVIRRSRLPRCVFTVLNGEGYACVCECWCDCVGAFNCVTIIQVSAMVMWGFARGC